MIPSPAQHLDRQVCVPPLLRPHIQRALPVALESPAEGYVGSTSAVWCCAVGLVSNMQGLLQQGVSMLCA